MIHKLIVTESNTKITRAWERFEVQLVPSLLPRQLRLVGIGGRSQVEGGTSDPSGSGKCCDALGAQGFTRGVAVMRTEDKHAAAGHTVTLYFNWKTPTSFPFSAPTG